jgi:NADPH:quinone reductase
MRAFALESFDTPPRLRNDFAEPHTADNELLVRVHASSVNPVDAAIAAGVLKEMAEHDFPVTLGRDFAGLVEQVGSDVSRYRLGNEVYGFLPAVNPSVHDGSWSELITVPEDDFVALKPRSLEPARAGAAPLAESLLSLLATRWRRRMTRRSW